MKLVALATAAALAGPFYADPNSNAERQARKYDKQGRPEAARLMRSMAAVPLAFWFTSGTPKQVRKGVDRTVDAATKANAVACWWPTTCPTGTAAATRPAAPATTVAGSTASPTASATARRW